MWWSQCIVRLIAVGLLVAVGGCISPATCVDESLRVSPPQSPATLPEPPVNPAALADNSAAMSSERMTSNRMTAPIFGMDLLLGQQSGIRPSIALYSTEKSSFLVEGYYGGLLTKFGASEGAGAGARWVTSGGGHDAVTVGPGLDVLFNLNHGAATFLAPSVDIAWRHGFGDRAGLVLGLNAGLGIGLSGHNGDADGEQVSGRLTPLISLYTGLRY